ncbi:alpha/beta fold hydrolase [Teichococcus vastitatis]|uniref:Alpha/beta hydrolase n=1 Tax=Teichococcus vastitatis TaxID=2307076 RepID=A0ABS9W9N0_9PROT|nr:alpha/beta hydrolase [Pseudoroseomonas vastitatis]MCI0755951.1 alpha/beta hydrolase [Pseudoroseomonas vastitatis]
MSRATGRPWLRLVAAGGGALALLFWSQARAAERAARAWPPRGRFIMVEGVRIHLLEQGHGSETIVLLHGNGAMAEDFAISGILHRLSARFRVLAFDRPGFGHTERPSHQRWDAAAQAVLIAAALERLGVQQAVVVGHSWGALVARALAAQVPAQVTALVLVSGYHRPERRLDAALASVADWPGLGGLLCATLLPPLASRLLPRLLRRIFAPAPVPAEFRRCFPAPLAVRPAALRASAADTRSMDADAAWLAQQHPLPAMPVLILAGGEDRMVLPDRHAMDLHRIWPGSRLRVIPEGGHMLHHTHPGAVVEAIEDALKEIRSRRA